jgi:undecaprenyl-diphosphatase
VTTLEALWLGIVQGLTEFLPVSSSGHLVIFQTLMGLEDEGGLLFEVSVHVATLLAILIFYRRKVLELLQGAVRLQPAALEYVGKLGLGTVPAVAVTLVAKDAIVSALSSPVVAGCGLLLTGVILWTTRSTLPKAVHGAPTWMGALLIGCAQTVAILPGVSRSGTTVAAALALGIAPVAAAEFSFLLGVVAITGAAVLMLPDISGASTEQLSALAFGGLAALVSGVAAIYLFVLLLRRQTFYAFSYYAWSVGLLFLAWLAFTRS